MKPLHEELKEVRLENSITLDTVYEKTKIRVHLLEQLENGDFSIVPEPYLRAFLREYGTVLGLDPERVIARYENRADSIREPRPAPEPEQDEPAAADQETGAPVTNTQNEKIPQSPEAPAGDVITATATAGENEEPGKEPATEEDTPDMTEPSQDDETLSSTDDRGQTAEDEVETVTEKTEDEEITDDAETITDSDDETLSKTSDEQRSGVIGETAASDTDEDRETVVPAPPEPATAPPEMPLDQSVRPVSPPEPAAGETGTSSRHPSPPRRSSEGRLKVEEPQSGSTVFFALLVIILIIAAVVIVMMSRSGSF